MKIIFNNQATNTTETVATITGGNNMTLDEALNFVGEIINNESDDRYSYDGDNVIINGKRYWYEDLEAIVD